MENTLRKRPCAEVKYNGLYDVKSLLSYTIKRNWKLQRFIVVHSYKSVYGVGGATQKSLELQVFPRNYQCLMVSRMMYFGVVR